MARKKKIIIEARINEYELRDGNPNVPYTPEEIAEDARACAEAGAAVVHFHARHDDGSPDFAPDTYADIITRIRARSSILTHPTLGSLKKELPLLERLRPMLDLARDPATAPDILPLCLSSPNWDFYDEARRDFSNTEKVYLNPTAELLGSIKAIQAAGIKLACLCWDVGATRRAEAFLGSGRLDGPVYLPFHLTSGGMLAGHPGTISGLEAHLAFLPRSGPVEWAALNLHGSMLPLAERIAREGGHIQIGIGDYHYREEGAPTNAALVARVVDIARAAGREIATPEEAREMLGMSRRNADCTQTGSVLSIPGSDHVMPL